MTPPRVTKLFQDLADGALAITSNRRLARQVERRYARWQIENGASAWPAPDVRPFHDWCARIWQSIAASRPDVPHLLSDDQELLLWEQMIRRRNTDDNALLLQLTGTARAARQSWWRIHDWRLDWESLGDYKSADTEAFLGWAEDLRDALHDRHWLSPAELPGYLLEHADDWLEGRGQPVWWMGFDALPRAAGQLRELLAGRGFPQHEFDNAGLEPDVVSIIECADADDEWHRIARWARNELSADPRRALGVVCPDLHKQRDRIEEILEDVLHPELLWRVDAPRVFHLSLGRALTEFPIVGTALDLLRWLYRRIPFEVVSRTLRSPYCGGAETERAARTNLEVSLRKLGQESLTRSYLRTRAERDPDLPRLVALLEAAGGLEVPQHADPAAWAALFTEWLRAFAWPAERPLDSHEFQTVQAWREQLSRFAALGTVRDRWTLGEALNKLTAMTSMRVLQFHDDEAPLQVMGASEAPGLWFDELWLSDMSDAVWPPPAQADPFIPVPLQKACGMPEASAQSVLEHTRVRTDNLLAGAGRISVSFASWNAEAPVALSPLFAGRRVEQAERFDGYQGRTAQVHHNAPGLEAIKDQRAPELAEAFLHGGVNLVADQARCPFRALVHHRLRARELPEVTPGLNAMERGTILHDVARDLWRRLGDQQTLNVMDAKALRVLVTECVVGVLARQWADSPFQRRFLDIERRRLEALLMEWLVQERRRPPFRVTGTELAAEVDLDGVTIRIRVDRIDELNDGRRLVVDYKTGQLANPADWADPRMDEPQLPIYALGVNEDVAALALVRIRRGECELRGVGDNVEGMPSLKSVNGLGFRDMDELKAWWRSVLGELAGGYRRGAAAVDPRDPQTCRSCDAMSLCRIFERSAAD